MFRLFSSCSKKKIFQTFWREEKPSKNSGNVEALVFGLSFSTRIPYGKLANFVAGDLKTKIVAILIGQFRGGRFKGQNRVGPKFL